MTDPNDQTLGYALRSGVSEMQGTVSLQADPVPGESADHAEARERMRSLTVSLGQLADSLEESLPVKRTSP